MHTSLEITMRIAILQSPEIFAMKEEEVNPLLQYTFVAADFDDVEIDYDDVIARCIHNCEKTIASKINQILNGDSYKSVGSEMLASNIVKKALLNNGSSEKEKVTEPKKNGKGGKISVKQLRYLGYLQHQMGEKPDYKEISKLSIKQATMKIKDLEKEIKSKK